MSKINRGEVSYLNYSAYVIFIQHWLYEEATPKNEVKSSIGYLHSEYDKDVLKIKNTSNSYYNLIYKCKTKQKKINNISRSVINRLTNYATRFKISEDFFLLHVFHNPSYYNELFYNHNDKIMEEQLYKKMLIIHFDIPRISKYREYLSKIRVLL